jgi:hypothetical protein
MFVGIAIGILLFIGAAIVSSYDRFAVQREYAARFAERHGGIPPLVDWFFAEDPDPEVEYLRIQHRNLTILAGVLGVAAAIVVVFFVSVSTPG